MPRFRNKPLAVVGGGDSAVEEADYLSKFASTVYMVHRRARASRVEDHAAAGFSQSEDRNPTGIADASGPKYGVTGIRFKRRRRSGVRRLPKRFPRLASAATVRQGQHAAGVGSFAAIGHTPNTAFLKGKLALTEKKYIRWTTPARTYTSVEGVFAAGDVADDYYRQAITAAGSGCMAAARRRTLAGRQGTLRSFVPSSVGRGARGEGGSDKRMNRGNAGG